MADAAALASQRVIARLRQQGVRDVSAALARPGDRKWIDVLRLLAKIGARPPADVVGGAVEVLKGADFALMVELGADVRNRLSLVALALETYARDPDGKHRILDVMADQGVPLPDTPPMAVHRGRLDLLERHLQRDPSLLTRTLTHEEIYPPALACHDDHDLALVGVPLEGATLLHMATDYEELEIARWLLDRGMHPDARARVAADAFGGHTPLFHCVVGYNAGRRHERLTHLLLDAGADPNARASIRKRLPFARDTSMHEYRDVTPVGWARGLHDQSYVVQNAVRLIAERGGRE
jgi:hypothetical protein